MSHRTQDLPPLTGPARIFRELRYHEGTRQGFAVVLVVLYAATAAPLAVLAAIGLPIGMVGALVRLYASGYILKNQQLATDGPYRFVRHPLYTGNILLVIGFALAGSRWWGLPVALFFFWFYYPPAIEYEDRKLRRIFGGGMGTLGRDHAGARAGAARPGRWARDRGPSARVRRSSGNQWQWLVVGHELAAQRRAAARRIRDPLRTVGRMAAPLSRGQRRGRV